MQREEADSSTGVQQWSAEKLEVLRRLAATLLLLLLVAVFARSTSSVAYGPEQHWIWGVFHYYLGAKYFPELGYTNLYACALQADNEAEGRWDLVDSVRGMESYQIGSRFLLAPCPRANFSAEKWAAFTRDVEFFAAAGSPEHFDHVFEDKGFNPPPSWVALARPFAQAVPLSSGLTRIMFNLDIAAIIAGMLIIWWGGSGVAAILTGWLAVIYAGSFGLIAGNFFQYFWFPLVILAAVLWQKRKPEKSGIALGLAVGLQVFPVFFGIPIMARWLIELRRGNKESRIYLKFSGALALTVLSCVLVGSTAGRGPGAWGEWNSKIAIHRNYLAGEVFNIGLANLTAMTVSGNREDAHSYSEDLPNTLARLDALQRKLWIYHAAAAILLAAWLLIVAHAPPDDLFGYGFLAMYIAVTLSPFYCLSLALIPFMFWNATRAIRIYTATAAITLFLFQLVLFRTLSVSFDYTPHLIGGYSIALFWAGLVTTSLFDITRRSRHGTAYLSLPARKCRE